MCNTHFNTLIEPIYTHLNIQTQNSSIEYHILGLTVYSCIQKSYDYDLIKGAIPLLHFDAANVLHFVLWVVDFDPS